MKQEVKKKLLMMAGLAFSSGLLAQTAFKGQLYINDEKFHLQGELLHVQLRFSYDGNILNSGETLNLTPVLKSGSQMLPLSSVVVNGSERSKYQRRGDAFAHRVRSNVAVVTADKRKGSRFFIYDTTIPYSDWMQGASLFIESEEHGWGKKPHVYEDKVFNTIPISGLSSRTAQPNIGRATQSYVSKGVAKPEWIIFLSTLQASTGTQSINGQISLHDDHNIGMLSGNKFDKAVLEAITSQLEDNLGISGSIVSNLQIEGFTAPVGNYRNNEKKMAERASHLKQFLMTNRTLGSEGLTVTWVAEDWDSIANIVEGSQMPLKTAALDIIKSVPVVSGREDQLQMLGGGSAYAYMKRYVFPSVERIKYTATFKTAAQNGNNTYNNDSRNVSLTNMLATAQNFSKGSKEYNDIVDLMARLFPENAEANINAAGAALMRGDLSAASDYLSAWQTDSRAYCNLGVLYMLQEDYDKAEVYLKMASANGVKEAGKALRNLDEIRN